MSCPDSDARNSYNGASAFPTLTWNGDMSWSGATTTDATGLPYRATIESLLGEPSAFKLTVNSVDFTAPTGTIDIDIEVMQDVADVSNMFLRMAVTEDSVRWGGTPYDDVTRDMIDDVALTVSNLGEVQNVVTTFPVDAAWITSKLEIIAFIQDDTDKKVHQAASSQPNPDYCLRFYALGERQVVGPPSGFYTFDDFSVFNLGNLTDTFTVDLTGDLPSGWFAGICDEFSCYGTTYTQVLAPGESMELHVLVSPTSSGYAPISVEMSQARLVHAFPRALDYSYFTDDLDVIVVDDDGSETYEDYLTDALDYNGSTYGVWNRLAGTPGTAFMSNFPVIIWSVGWAFPTVTAEDRAALSAYMDAGGSLLITGQDIGWELQDEGGAAYQWYQNYLHAIFRADDTNDYTLSGVPGDEVSDGIDLVIQGGDGANNQQYPSDIDPADTSATVIWTYDASRNGAIRADNGTYRVIYMAFGFEAINNADDRRDVIQAAMHWLSYGVSTDVGGDRPAAPSRIALLGNSPNPFNPTTRIMFVVPGFEGEAAHTLVDIFDIGGRRVTTLVDGPLPSGEQSITWNGTAEDGRPTSSGLYFVRLRAAGEDVTRKITLIR